ncbi:uncharacterized protein LOC115426316 [Sphaeramia orbicularis]|uniref:uncharacterized protein LOC115426316 n=1 Tax=Sphaeramia orbicularis TaxID=375764 RepID=UPI00117E390F|nr:uncharacterized protein LOC115426316 [Sphaeramia orbicularis]
MKISLVVNLCFITVVCAETSGALEVRGYVGGQVSIHCSGSWTTNTSSNLYNMYYFCKGVCSKENILIQAERIRDVIVQRGRYSMEVSRGAGVINVTVMRLRQMDAGKYHCGLKNNFTVWHQEVIINVLDGPTVPPGSSQSNTTLQTQAQTLTQGNLPSSTVASGALSTPPATVEMTKKQGATSLTDTTIVIIVSVSLALLVCAIIPVIFYGHWRSNAVGENISVTNTDEGDYCVEHRNVASTQTEMRMQALETAADAQSSIQDVSQYASIYQALDPKALD